MVIPIVGCSSAPSFGLTAPATALNVRMLRHRLRRWLAVRVEDPDIIGDLCLAASEAMENAVDHAFTDRPVGTVEVRAEDTGPPPAVSITVTDDGRWQTPTDPGFRGRGLPLITRLTCGHDLDRGPRGTRVTFHRSITPPARPRGRCTTSKTSP